MKKSYFALAAVAALFASCSQEVLVDDVPEAQSAISFETFTNLATRPAENSSATNKWGLESYHQDFNVWGYKNVASTDVKVFDQQEVNWDTNTDAWTYTPLRFWDKSAAHYKFYAAAPADATWSFDETSRKLSYADYSLTGATLDPSTSVNNKAVFSTDTDLMISHDITNYTTYTSATVNFEFDHILSRLNIGVKKASTVTETVTLNEVKIFNMKSNGTFDEANAAASTSGNNSRWLAASTPAKFTSGVGYATDTEVTGTENFIYQALCIPQTVNYAACNLDGTGLGADSNPYLKIKYTINSEDYTYYYNLADIFNGAGSSENVDFFEGWQNTLHITINPVAIEFDADVYEWVTKNDVDVNVPNE